MNYETSINIIGERIKGVSSKQQEFNSMSFIILNLKEKLDVLDDGRRLVMKLKAYHSEERM